jgi:hypothetical protein
MAPTQFNERAWQEGNTLCGFCSSGHMLMGCCCPCMLINKTAELIEHPEEKEPSGCGKTCVGWSALNLCGVGFM